MKIVLFYHSFASCWNHGNAHFLRGIAREFIRLGHDVSVYEPEDGWSRMHALQEGGAEVLQQAAALVGGLHVHKYARDTLDVAAAVDGADLVLVHEWNTPSLIGAIGLERVRGGSFALFFHDTHHRAVTAPAELERFDLDGYDGILAFGAVLADIYRQRGWGRRAYVWHEAADTALFQPLRANKDCDLIWIGNWGDDERTAELEKFLIAPARELKLRTRIHGVRYPDEVKTKLSQSGISYRGWLPNHCVPEAFATSVATVHVPRRPYTQALPGIPTIRMFEALACGIPLVSAPWDDVEGLFPRGCYLEADDSASMRGALQQIFADTELRQSLSESGPAAINARHSCAHRVRELLDILDDLQFRPASHHAIAEGTFVS